MAGQNQIPLLSTSRPAPHCNHSSGGRLSIACSSMWRFSLLIHLSRVPGWRATGVNVNQQLSQQLSHSTTIKQAIPQVLSFQYSSAASDVLFADVLSHMCFLSAPSTDSLQVNQGSSGLLSLSTCSLTNTHAIHMHTYQCSRTSYGYI